MLKKRIAAMGLGVLLSMSVFTVPALAHGHHSGGHHRQAAVSAGTAAAGNCAGTPATCPVHADSDAQCPVCAVDGCTETGHHYHDNTVYCGYPHEHGYCDGTCAQGSDQAPSASVSGNRNYRRHHGCY